MKSKSGFNISLIIKYFQEETLPEENQEVLNWVKYSKENSKLFSELKLIWETSGFGNNNLVEISQTEWEKLNSKLEDSNKVVKLKDEINEYSEKDRSKVKWLPNFLRIAAAIIITFGITWFLFTYLHQTDIKTSQFYEFTTPYGAKSQVNLPDGTKIWLNSGSKVKFPEKFESLTRDIYLEGEAFFEVAKMKDRPFIVKTADINIKALGTSFNVKAYPDEKTVETTLVEGIVKIESDKKAEKVINITLKPNQKVTYYKQAFKETKMQGEDVKTHEQEKFKEVPLAPQLNKDVKTELYTSWKDQKWIIESENLKSLAKELERKFNIMIIFESEDVANYKFTGTIENETLEQLLVVLKYSSPIDYKIEKGIVRLNINESLKSKYNKVINK